MLKYTWILPIKRINFRTIAYNPINLPLLGVFGSFPSPKSRLKSTYIIRTPPSSAPREVPTPLVFVSSSSWDTASQQGLSEHASMFTERGYTCIEIDIGPPETLVGYLDSNKSKDLSTKSILPFFESELARHIRLIGIPFPPVILSRSAGTLISQQYISSNPASGLVLISPPIKLRDLQTTGDNELPDSRETDEGLNDVIFDFEPTFPVVIVETRTKADAQRKENRLLKDERVDMIVVDDVGSQETFYKIEQWLDEIGV